MTIREVPESVMCDVVASLLFRRIFMTSHMILSSASNKVRKLEALSFIETLKIKFELYQSRIFKSIIDITATAGAVTLI